MRGARNNAKRKDESGKCKHPPCTCKVPAGTKYCGVECESKGETPEISCNCGHPQCKGGIE